PGVPPQPGDLRAALRRHLHRLPPDAEVNSGGLTMPTVRFCRVAVLSSLLLAAVGSAQPQSGSCCDVEWGYHGAEAPDHWADLSPCYKPCNGGEQSPI